jgi:hypothetical protein
VAPLTRTEGPRLAEAMVCGPKSALGSFGYCNQLKASAVSRLSGLCLVIARYSVLCGEMLAWRESLR